MTDELDRKRAEQLLRDMKEGPFVAVIFDGDNLTIYTKGLDERRLRMIEQFVERISAE